MKQTSLTAQIARWVVLVPLFIIPFIPLYVANDLFFPFITGKGFAFRILMEIAFTGWVILALADKNYRPRFSWTFVLYGAFIAWMLVADLLGVNPHKALWSNFERMEGWVTLIHVFLFFVVSGAVLTADKLWRKWWLTFIAASALLTAYCLIQVSGGAPIHQGGVRVDGTFGNAAYLAAYLLFATAITVWQALESKGWLRWTLIALAFAHVVIIFLSATRGAILGLIAAALVGAFLFAFESGKRERKIALGVLIGILVLAGGFFLARDTAFVKGDPTLSRISAIGPSDLTVRFTLWSMALEGVAERPITGWGQEGFNQIFNKHYRPSLFAQEPWFDRAHNAFLDWLVAGGIPGFLLFLATFAMGVIALYRGNASRPERILLVTALVAYAVQAMVVFDNIFTYIPLAAILAMAHAASARPWPTLDAPRTLTDSEAQVAVPVIVVLGLIMLWFVNVPNITAASQLVRAITVRGSNITQNITLFKQAIDQNSFGNQEIREQLTSFATAVAGAQGHPSEGLTQLMTYALGEMSKEVEKQPNDARLRLQLAVGYRSAGDFGNALKQIQAALDLSPKKQNTLLEQGFEYWQIGQFGLARDSFHKAYALDTSFDRLVPFAAAGDIAAGDVAAGKKLLNDRLGTTTVDSEVLVLAYYQAKDYTDLILTLEEQVRAQQGSADSYFRLAAAYAEAGYTAQARATVAKAVAGHPEAAAQATEFLSHLK